MTVQTLVTVVTLVTIETLVTVANLNILADINRQLQKANQSLYVMCCKISAFNLRPLEAAVVKFYGDDFQKHPSQCQ